MASTSLDLEVMKSSFHYPHITPIERAASVDACVTIVGKPSGYLDAGSKGDPARMEASNKTDMTP